MKNNDPRMNANLAPRFFASQREANDTPRAPSRQTALCDARRLSQDRRMSLLPASDEPTLRFYAAKAADYAASAPQKPSRHLAPFLDLLPPGATILELGCGAGRESEAMIARGFAVEPTDGSPEMARIAEERLGQPVRVLRFDALDTVEAFDGVFAHASLLHVPRLALPAVLAAIARALKPGGVHFANFKAGGAGGRDGLGRYYNQLTAEEAKAVYLASGDWELLSLTEYEGGGYDGQRSPWVALTLRKRPS